MPIKTPHTKAEKQAAVHTVMHEFKHGQLHSGSKTGPKVTNPSQAKAIAMSESNQGYDRSAHHKGNPGFEGTGSVHSPPHDLKTAPGEGNGMHGGVDSSAASQSKTYVGGSPHVVGSCHPARDAHSFRVSGQTKSGVLRMSGHKGAHRVGKGK